MNETWVRYNGVDIRNVLTDSIDQTVQLDPTGTDPIYVLTTATFTGILHCQANSWEETIGIDGRVYGTEAGDAFRALIAPLMQPRRRFTLQIGNKVVFDVHPGHERVIPNLNVGDRLGLENIDANHGPLPSVRVLSVISANTIRLQFTIKLHIPWQDRPGRHPHGIISFRFWIAEDINCEDWTTNRVYHGRVRVAHLGHNVLTEFKQYFWCPALQLGFLRRRISFNQSPNGLELEFTISDQEVWAVPPPPSTRWVGTHTISSPKPGLCVLESNLDMELSAPKTVAKRPLMALCWKIVTAKLHITSMFAEKQDFVQSAQWRDNLGDNRVGAAATIKHLSPKYPIDEFCLPLNELSPPFPNYDISKAALPYPTATIQGLFLAFLNDPCHVEGWPQTTPPKQKKSNDQGTDDPPPPDPSQDVLDINKQNLTTSHLTDGMYNLYLMSSDVDIDRGVCVFPFSKQSGQQSNATSAVVRMHNGFATRTVTIQAERLGNWPQLPAPISFQSRTGMYHEILSDHPHASAPQLSADFVKTLYRMDYVLRYALERIPNYANNEYVAGLLPYRTFSDPKLYIIPATGFVAPTEII